MWMQKKKSIFTVQIYQSGFQEATYSCKTGTVEYITADLWSYAKCSIFIVIVPNSCKEVCKRKCTFQKMRVSASTAMKQQSNIVATFTITVEGWSRLKELMCFCSCILIPAALRCKSKSTGRNLCIVATNKWLFPDAVSGYLASSEVFKRMD